MNTLAIDCSSSIMSVSLEIGERLYESSIQDGFKNSENLMPLIDSIFKNCKLNPSELDLIAVALGPGSFTGLRIAMATAKGIAMGSDTPLVTVSTLDAYSKGNNYFEGVIVPVIDARKKRVYCSLFENGIKKMKDLDITPEQLLELVKNDKKILITGPDAELFRKISEKDNRIYIDDNFTTTASTSILKLGKEKFLQSGQDLNTTGPLYIRKSEAEISLYGE
jgi:tRNA threonylcarbamoyladenosine biosynthesis protein TsaB